MDHWNMCLSQVMRQARTMKDRADKGEINESCIEGILRSYVTQPAYWPGDRNKLVEQALTSVGIKHAWD